jgi:protoporphyrinogen oxidase
MTSRIDGETSEAAPVVIIGAGPAGLTAAYQLIRRRIRPLVLEKSELVGGIARTEQHNGYRFDIGGHRFFTKVPEVEALWREILDDDFLTVPRLSRIFYEGRFYKYPIELRDTLANLGLRESAMILLSYLRWMIRPYPVEETFEQWVTNRFGRRLYRTFFRTYTEKVWGIPCSRIRAEWAAQRIRGLSLIGALLDALFGRHDTATLIKEFSYPRLGPGMMWERVRDLVEKHGGRVEMGTETVRLHRDGRRIVALTIIRDGARSELGGQDYISTMPIDELIARIDPPPPAEVAAAAAGLCYRDFLVVGLILRGAKYFPDNWIYVHTPGLKVSRIQNFSNWSREMVPDPDTTSLGLEYFCNRGDEIWEMADQDLIDLARRELVALGFSGPEAVRDARVIRQPKAYPVYDESYRQNLDAVRRWLETLQNLQTIGRNGMHRYNNQDHSMLTAMLAVENLMGGSHDLWEVNTERSYQEDFIASNRAAAGRAGSAARAEP